MDNWNINFNGKFYSAKFYEPQDHCIGDCSFDSETALITKKSEFPQFVLGMAYNGNKVYFIKDKHLKTFFDKHKKNKIYMANCPFDLGVVQKAQAIEDSLKEALLKNHIVDIFILDKLVKIATTGANSIPSLDRLAVEYMGINLPKDIKDSKGNEVRTSYGNFIRKDGSVNYEAMEQVYFIYAGIDAIATWDIAQKVMTKATDLSYKFNVPEEKLLSHYLMNPKSVMLDRISKRGLLIDRDHLLFVRNQLQEQLDETLAILKINGWEPGEGSSKKMQFLISGFSEITLPKTATGKIKISSSGLKKYEHIEFVSAYMEYIETKKLMDFLKLDDETIHSRFNPVVATGRTSSFAPNIQNMPRNPLIRPMFIARPGYCFVSVDYSAIELGTLAQTCYNMFGFSKMRDLINEGIDLHTYFASKIMKTTMDQVDKPSRNKAKAFNFGVPGGLGIKSFVDYALLAYGVLFTEEEAKELKELWLDTFPEMRLYLSHDDIKKLVGTGLMDSYIENINSRTTTEIASFIFKGIISGQTSTKSGREYSEAEIEWAFDVASQMNFPNKEDKVDNKTGKVKKKGHIHSIAKRSGGLKLWGDISRSLTSVVTDSGRVRDWCTYTQSKNTPFQSRAADGATSAGIRLALAGLDMVNFIHDEYILEVPLSKNLRELETEIATLMIQGMKVHVPDVTVRVEAEYMISWNKAGTHIIDTNGKLIPIKSLAETLGYESWDKLTKEIAPKWNNKTGSYMDLITLLKTDYKLNDCLVGENALVKEAKKNKKTGHELEFFNELQAPELDMVA